MRRRALVSLFKKDYLDELGALLRDHDIEIISTGGTARALTELGFAVTSVEEVTGSAEYPGGLVKTLHPKIHFAILANRDDPEHVARMEADGIVPIDFVFCNLYAFGDVANKAGVTDKELHDLIDVGGPTMIRAAAKNWEHVTVIVDPEDYALLDQEFNGRLDGSVSPDFRKTMAVKAFAHTADYDSLIDVTLAKHFSGHLKKHLSYVQGDTLRYGENPHQKGIVYRDPHPVGPSIIGAKQLWGKELSYNNIVDGEAALETVLGFKECAIAVVKHSNPCGLATGHNPELTMPAAWAGDPVSAFGSVIACNRPFDLETYRQFLENRFVEVIIAPEFVGDFAQTLAGNPKKKNIRLLEVGDFTIPKRRIVYRFIQGGLLEQEDDDAVFADWDTVTKAGFPEGKGSLAHFAFQAVKYVKSNEIVIAREYEPSQYQVLAIGAGQPNRVDAIRKLALVKARENLRLEYEGKLQIENCKVQNEETGQSANGKVQIDIEAFESYVKEQLGECVLASGAFFPFRDNIDVIAEAGLRYVVQPGGSMRDEEVIGAADELGIAMIHTGMRHFRH